MERNTIYKSFIESKRNAYDMGEDGNQSYIISTFAILNNLSESKSRLVLNDYLFDSFLKSNKSNFDSFVLQEMKYKEQDSMTQIGSDIPQSVRPEQPIKDEDENDYKESLYEEDESDDDYEIEEDEEESDTSESDTKLTPIIIDFMNNTHLTEASEQEAKLFLSRFKEILEESIENEYARQLIILLLYKAKFEPENLSDGEIEELEDMCYYFNGNFEDEESEDDSDTIEESYKRLFEVDDEDLKTSTDELAKIQKKKNDRIQKKKSNKDKRKQKKAFNKNVSNIKSLKKGIDTISKDTKQGIISKGKEIYKKYPITSVLLGGAALLGFGSIAITGWFILSKLSNAKFKKAKKEMESKDLLSDLQKDDIKNLKSKLKGVNDSLGIKDTTKPQRDSDTSETQNEPNTDDSSNDLTASIDSETQEEINQFDSEIQDIQDNQSQIKSELVTQTREDLNDPEVKERVDNEVKKKREYVKKNKKYWGKDQVVQTTDSDTKDKPKDNKKDNKKKKPDVKQKPSNTKKPVKKGDTKKPVDSKTNGSAKAKTKPGDTKKQPIKTKPSDTKKPMPKKGDTSKTGKTGDTKPKPNENIDAYKKRTGKTKVPAGYVTDPKTKRITKKKENYDVYKLLF